MLLRSPHSVYAQNKTWLDRDSAIPEQNFTVLLVLSAINRDFQLAALKHSYPLKNLPAPVRSLLRPWFAVSIALHGILIYLPIPEAPPPPELVSLTELPPTVSIPLVVTPIASPSPTPAAPTPTPKLVIPPAPAPPRSIATPRSTSIATPRPAPVTPPTSAQSPTPAPAPIATPSPSPTPPTPTPTPTLSPTPTPTPSPTPSSEVPLVEGAIAGCLGSEQCWETPDTQWRSIARNLQQTLRGQGYELTEIPLSDDTGRRVYRLTKPDEPPQYLNLISTLQGTRYLFSEEQMTTEQLNEAAGS